MFSTKTYFDAFHTPGRVFGLKGLVFVGKSDKSEERLMVAEGDIK